MTRTRKRKAIDPVDVASADSFPASDPPAWTATGSGSPAPDRSDDELVWNAAIEAAARTIEETDGERPKSRMAADVRTLKRPARQE